jgi:hypothetical protein
MKQLSGLLNVVVLSSQDPFLNVSLDFLNLGESYSIDLLRYELNLTFSAKAQVHWQQVKA